MPNPLDMTRMLKNPLVLAGAGMLAGSMPRPQAQAHINPWQAGMQGFLAGSELNQRDQALATEEARQKAAEKYMQDQSAQLKWLQQNADTEREHEIKLAEMDAEAELKAAQLSGSGDLGKAMFDFQLTQLGDQLEADREAAAEIEKTSRSISTAIGILQGGAKTGPISGMLGGRKFWPGGTSAIDYDRLYQAFGENAIMGLKSLGLTPVSDADIDKAFSIAANMSFHEETNLAILETQKAVMDMAMLKINARKNVGMAAMDENAFNSWFETAYKPQLDNLKEVINKYDPNIKNEKRNTYNNRYGLEF
jgi:hypothetical protein